MSEQVPLQILYGIDVAIKKLRPNASFQIDGQTFTKWEDPDGLPPPNWQDIWIQVEKDKQAYEEQVKAAGDRNV